MHMLIQLLGFSHPQDLFATDVLPDTFRRLWYFVASISFRSTEGFAHYLNEDVAMQTLASLPLLPLTKKQRGMIGEKRARESLSAQCLARGIDDSQTVPSPPPIQQGIQFPSHVLQNSSTTPQTWTKHIIEEVATSTARTGNHVCRSDVCHKGHIGKKGFCRMFYWHWTRREDAKKGSVAVRSHGMELVPRWNGEGDPPLFVSPPFLGAPALETTHPFHFKLCPSMLLGPMCNHDLGVLLRLPSNATKRSNKEGAISAMLEAMGDHEFYCGSYSGKESTHVSGLLMTLADGLRSKELDIAVAKEAGQNLDGHEIARRMLHRLISSTNRRMHKGFPEMLTYLLRKPMEYSSHEFVHCSIDGMLRKAWRAVLDQNTWVEDFMHPADNFMAVQTHDKLKAVDYHFRPTQLEDFPLYFFLAGCRLVKKLNSSSMDWRTVSGRRSRFYEEEPMLSTQEPTKGHPLLDGSHQQIHKYSHYVQLMTDTNWKVPILHTRLPRVPDATATPSEQGNYALCLMLLFRAHREFRHIIPTSKPSTPEEAWIAVYNEFLRWRTHEIDAVAAAYFRKDKSQNMLEPMLTASSDDPARKAWWACMISEKLRNYDTAKGKHHNEASATPHDLDVLPEYEDICPFEDEAEQRAANGNDSDQESRGSQDVHPEDQDMREDLKKARAAPTDTPVSVHCGNIPQGFSLDDFHNPPSAVHARNGEAKYWQDAKSCLNRILPDPTQDEVALAQTHHSQLDGANAIEAAERQQSFFKAVDGFRYESLDTLESSSLRQPKPSNFDITLAKAVNALPKIRPTQTIVMEAAFSLLETGLLNIPDVGTINVKQAILPQDYIVFPQ